MSRPVILDYITPRLGDSAKVFVYDYSKDMNVLKDNQDLEFIGCSGADCMTQTETRVARESDDNEYRICELETKTEVTRERDDEGISSLVELISKTFADRERDDEDGYYLD